MNIPYHRPISIIPPGDEARLSRLRDYQMLDTPHEEAFDKIARLASMIFSTPNAFVTLIDSERAYFKANLSPMGDEIPREHSLCSLAILEPGNTVFEDTHDHPDLMSSPYVSCSGGIRFYAASPLRTADGHALGTLCVVDSKPHRVAPEQMKMLETLAGVVMEEMDNRWMARKTLTQHREMVSFMVHELKNPTHTALLSTDLITEATAGLPEAKAPTDMLRRSLHAINDRVNGMLTAARSNDPRFQLKMEAVDMAAEVAGTLAEFQMGLVAKNMSVRLEANDRSTVHADRTSLRDVLRNLISNAMKFSPAHSVITVRLKQHNGQVVLELEDEGQGMSKADIDQMFGGFSRLSAVPTAGESSTGLGLYIASNLVQLSGGRIWATSPGIGKGSTLHLSFPALT